jgi:hypothetical protein
MNSVMRKRPPTAKKPASPRRLKLHLGLMEHRHLPARPDARPRVHVHDDRPEPTQIGGRACRGILTDSAHRLAGVEDRPVLPVRIDRGVTAGRAHGERHQRLPKMRVVAMMAFVVVMAWSATFITAGLLFFHFQ